MNKKLFYAVGGTLFVAAAIFILLLTHSPRVDAYAHVIPEDVKALARIDLRQFVDEAQLSASDELRLMHRLLFSDDGRETGLDIARPVYAFATNDGDLGIVARVDDPDRLDEHLQTLHAAGKAGASTTQRDITWTVIQGQWLMAHDDDKALVMGPAIGSAQDYLHNLMAKLMQQERDASGMMSQLYIELGQRQAPVAAVVAADMLPKEVQTDIRSFANLPSLQNLHLGIELHTKDNTVSLDIDMLPADAKMQDAIAKIGDWLRPIDGKLIDNCSPDAALWLCTNIDGNRLLSEMRNVQDLRMMLIMLNTVADVDAIVKAIDGDIAIEMDDAAGLLTADLPPIMLTAHLRDTDFLSEANYWLQTASKTGMFAISATSPTDFVLDTQDMKLLFGVSGQTLYLTNSGDMKPDTDGRTDTIQGFVAQRADDIRGKRLFATLKTESLPESMRQAFAAAGVPVDAVDCVELTMPGVDKLTLRITARDGRNIARTILLGNE